MVNRNELRLCKVKDEIGYFHTWEQWANVVDASPLRGGHPGGQVSQAFGIVEFSDGVRRVDPTEIQFCDETNKILKEYNEMKKLKERALNSCLSKKKSSNR